MKRNYIIPIFVPHLGCPMACTFCNQKKISGEKKQVTAKDVKKTIEYYLKNFKDEDANIEVAFFGGSFTGIDEKVQNELLEAANEFIDAGKVDSIRISTRPDYIDKKILKRLKKYNVKCIELGVQSTNDYILKKAKRGHTFADVKKASKLIRWHGFKLGHQMMVGLQDSTLIDEMNTAKDLAKLKPKMVRIYPVLVIKGTELEEEYLNDEYEPLTVEQAVERCKEIYNFFNKKKINVIRIGLQNTDEISDPKNELSEVVAGPYHENFRQLVEGSIYYDAVVEKIKSVNVKVKEIKIICNPKIASNIVGYKKANIEKLYDIYDVDLVVEQDDSFPENRYSMTITKEYKDYNSDDETILSKCSIKANKKNIYKIR